MTNIHQLSFSVRDDSAKIDAAINQFNKMYPHNPGRRSKAKLRAMIKKITIPGGCVTQSQDKDSGKYLTIEHNVTPDELVSASIAYFKAMIPKGSQSYSPDTTYVPYAYTWLNSGAYQDYVEE